VTKGRNHEITKSSFRDTASHRAFRGSGKTGSRYSYRPGRQPPNPQEKRPAQDRPRKVLYKEKWNGREGPQPGHTTSKKLSERGPNRRSRAYLTAAHDLVLRRSQFRQREGSAAVQLLRADAHLGAEAEFCAVGEAS
jgi:hypothetical protein